VRGEARTGYTVAGEEALEEDRILVARGVVLEEVPNPAAGHHDAVAAVEEAHSSRGAGPEVALAEDPIGLDVGDSDIRRTAVADLEEGRSPEEGDSRRTEVVPEVDRMTLPSMAGWKVGMRMSGMS
jgi:hypothetical protein